MADVQRNIDTIINSVNLVTRNSAKSGRDYTMLQIVLDNGYAIEIFPERAESKLIDLLLDGAKKAA